MDMVEMKDRTATQDDKYQANKTAVDQKENSLLTNCLNRKQLKINKALVPLKIALFCWYGGGSILQTFIPVYLSQIGLTVHQQSLIYLAAPLFQFLGPVISGLIADKIGRSKPVLYANIALALVFINAVLLIPKVEHTTCRKSSIETNCSFAMGKINSDLDFNDTKFPLLTDSDLKFCDILCPDEDLNESISLSGNISTFNRTTHVLRVGEELFEYHMYAHVSNDGHATINSTSTDRNKNVSRCEKNIQCHFKCFNVSDGECDANGSSNVMVIFIISFVLLILYSCTFSNCYRFLDVTCMAMVKMHDSDFGRERLWSILSIAILSPLCGYLIKLTGIGGGSGNYASAFYFFDGTTLITILAIIKLDVQINPPGKQLWKKALSLVRKPDVLVFYILLVVLGTSWCFTKNFSSLYLHQLDAPSVLLGMLPGINALAGLPFLATSNWWVKKIGSSNLLILALLSFTFQCIGYSFLVNPWFALACELFGIFNYHLSWVAVITHSHKIAPEGLTASTIATAGALHFGVGKGTGSAVGLIMGRYGGKTAYRFVAAMCGISAILFMVYRYLRRQRRNALADLKSATKP